MSKHHVIGFGVPDEMEPHHFTVEIPVARNEAVLIVERFGLRGGINGVPEEIERCVLPRSIWSLIADDAKRVLNARLKEKGLPASRWTTKRNLVERLLGRELCVLAWGVEVAGKEVVPNAIRNWAVLRPDERWWLFSMAANMTGAAECVDIGWRKAIRIALTENPAKSEVVGTLRRRFVPSVDVDRPQISLFG
jgi:hypothetical protein